MLESAKCNVPLSSGFAEICQLVFRNGPTEEFYAREILFSGQFKEEGGSCMTELQINLTVFTLASFLFSQGLCFLGDRALHSSLSLLHTAHGQKKMSAGCVPGWVFLFLFFFTRIPLGEMWLHFRQRVWKTHLWPGPPAFDDQHIPAACSQWS